MHSPSKWDFFRNLKDQNKVNKDHETGLRNHIRDISDVTNESSAVSTEMDAMERTLKLMHFKDELSENIIAKIKDPKERFLVALLYKVCNDMDPTRMQFIKFAVMLFQHGIISDLQFLATVNEHPKHHHLPRMALIDSEPDDSDSSSCYNDDEDDDDDDLSFKDGTETDIEDLFDDKFGDLFDNENDEEKTQTDHVNTSRFTNVQRIDINQSERTPKSRNQTPLSIVPLEPSASYPLYKSRHTSPTRKRKRAPIDQMNFNPITSRYVRDFEELECIGYGMQGSVHKVTNKIDSSMYAIKKIIYKHSSNNHEYKKEQILREARSLATINHINVVRYFNSWIEPVTKSIVMNNSDYIEIDASEEKADRPLSFMGQNVLNPVDPLPIVRAVSHEDTMPLLKYQDAQSAFVSPYVSPFTSPRPPINNVPNMTASFSNLFDLHIPEHSDIPRSEIVNGFESNKQRTVDFQSICRYWKSQETFSCLFLQTEYCGDYTLKNFINDPDRIPNRDHNMHLFSQILLGLSNIHSHHILHRDMKPENIFLMKNQNNLVNHNGNSEPESKLDSLDPFQYTAKIGDFGLSKSIANEILTDGPIPKAHSFGFNVSSMNLTANTGTEVYAAPEQLLENQNEYGTAADMYSLGVILFELSQKAFESPRDRLMAIMNFRNNGKMDTDRLDHDKFSKEIELITHLTKKNPLHRPTAYHLIFDQYIQLYWMRTILNSAVPQFVSLDNNRSLEMPEKTNSDRTENNKEAVDNNGCDETNENSDHNNNSIKIHMIDDASSLQKSQSCFCIQSNCFHKQRNDNIETDLNESLNPKLHRKKSPPIYLVTSPSTPPNESKDNHCNHHSHTHSSLNKAPNSIRIMSPLCTSKMHSNHVMFEVGDIEKRMNVMDINTPE